MDNFYLKKMAKNSCFHKKYSHYRKNPMTLARYDTFEASHKISCKSISIWSLKEGKTTKSTNLPIKNCSLCKNHKLCKFFQTYYDFQLGTCMKYVHTKNQKSSYF